MHNMTGLSALDTKKKGGGVSADLLKLLALVSMTFDHYAAIVIYNGNLYGFDREYHEMAIATAEGAHLMRLYHIFRIIGRLAFPIFAFLLTEGFIHTKDRRKYLGRVLLMAFCAEVPFDLCLFNHWIDFSAQNIGFTLSVGILVMACMKKYRRKIALKWTCVAVGACLSELLHFDYGAFGIFLIALLYNFRKEKNLRVASGIFFSILLSLQNFGAAALGFLPIYFYNGEKGRLPLGRLLYFYYPLHLAFFYLLIVLGAKITA